MRRFQALSWWGIKARLHGWLTQCVLIGARRVRLNHQQIAESRLGILQYQTPEISGEKYFIERALPDLLGSLGGNPIILDAGANEGGYAALVLEAVADCRVHCFEPNPPTFARLRTSLGSDPRVKLNCLAVGDTASSAEIFDYAGREGSQHASLYGEVLTAQHRAQAVTRSTVSVIRIDDYLVAEGISDVALLKLDLEGHELAAIKGTREAIRQRRVAMVHFEFNEMNVISRTFLRDFYNELPGYDFYRMRHDGLIDLGPYTARSEIFQFQNIVAVRSDVDRQAVAQHIVKSVW